MKVAEINDAIERGRIRLPRKEWSGYYQAVWMLLVISILPLLWFEETGSFFVFSFALTVLFVVLAIAAFFVQHARLKLEVVGIRLTRKQVEGIIADVSSSLGWRRSKQTKRCYIARASKGGRVTILIQDDRIFINSISGSITSILNPKDNRRNMDTLIGVIRNHQSGY